MLSLFCKLIGMPCEHCLQLNFNHIYHLSEQPLPSECPWVVFRYNDLCTESTCYVYHWYTSPAASHHLTRTHTDKDKVMNDNTLMHSRQSAQTPHKRSNCTVALLETASQGMSAALSVSRIHALSQVCKPPAFAIPVSVHLSGWIRRANFL